MQSSKDAPAALRRIEAAVRTFALTFPEAWEDFPWGHSAFKVKKKIFASMGVQTDAISMSFKLPTSNREALLMPFTEPTHYGMGKHGWVTARFAPGDKPPMFLLERWIEESYRAIAPKTLVARLDGGAGVATASKKAASKKAASKKAASKKAAAKKPARKKS